MNRFLEESYYIDFSHIAIQNKAHELFDDIKHDIDKSKIAFEYVRDNIPHSFDINKNVITACASDVLLENTGICHAKANLLAALLRSQGIPVGFCYQHITLAETDEEGYCLHCYNAILLNNQWVKVDARGNTNGKDAQFSLETPRLAFSNRKEYDEYHIKGIYATPHEPTMQMLKQSQTNKDVMQNIPSKRDDLPDVLEG